MNVTVHIAHLVLDGLPVTAADSAAIQTAVQTELTRLLTEDSLARALQQGGAHATVQGADVHLPAGTTPAATGREIGAAIHEGLRT